MSVSESTDGSRCDAEIKSTVLVKVLRHEFGLMSLFISSQVQASWIVEIDNDGVFRSGRILGSTRDNPVSDAGLNPSISVSAVVTSQSSVMTKPV